MISEAAAPLLAALLLGLLLDALFGEPDWLWRRITHPVVAIGNALASFENRWNDHRRRTITRRALGALAVAIVVATSAAIAWGLVTIAEALGVRVAVEALGFAVLLAQRSLADHVGAVAHALERGLGEGRRAVSRIVGRDPEALDRHGVARGAIESAAENFADGVVAPLFWGLVAGLPGMAAYKALNTADSMIGHKDARHAAFGWAAARLDDLANLVPARLSGLFLALAAWSLGRSGGAALIAMGRDAPRHRSPNAGWPEAAMAGALGLRLAGPRRYGGRVIEDAWMGDGRAEVEALDIRAAVTMVWRAWAILVMALTGGLALALRA